MNCWICGAKNATRNFEYSGMFSARNLSDKVEQREKFKRYELFSNFEYEISARMFCQSCYDKHIKELQEKREEYAKLKKSLMFERAVRILEKQAVNMYEYKDIIDQMAEYVQEKPENFDSAHEMVAAIILVDNAISAKTQYKVGSYRVDFYIPEYKTILENQGDTWKRLGNRKDWYWLHREKCPCFSRCNDSNKRRKSAVEEKIRRGTA